MAAHLMPQHGGLGVRLFAEEVGAEQGYVLAEEVSVRRSRLQQPRLGDHADPEGVVAVDDVVEVLGGDGGELGGQVIEVRRLSVSAPVSHAGPKTRQSEG